MADRRTDVPTATQLGIVVVNSPSGNIGAAAEHTVALMLAVARNVPDGCSSLKAGKWERSRLVGVEVKNRTLGIIGLGKVGLNVARSGAGLGMQVEALDPYASPAVAEAAGVSMVSSLGDLLRISDFLTIHTPLIASTKGMIGTAELQSMKKGARILNVARGGMIDEAALLAALESGHLAGCGIDVFTQEPPAPDSAAAKLIAHPRAVVTPHLGASTVEAQENVSIDVCEQVVAILGGDLPRSAVNAPLILPEEFKTLQPFVRLVEKIGALYTQHHGGGRGPGRVAGPARTRFDLVYAGKVAELSSTRPLFAALVKGLVGEVVDAQVNLVNAELVARDRGLAISEQRARVTEPTTPYASLVTLRAHPTARSSSRSRTRAALDTSSQQPPKDDTEEHIICGYVSGTQLRISRLDRFAASFVPEGYLLVMRNFDSPGKIGAVGGLLGKHGININFMSVAPMSKDEADTEAADVSATGRADAKEGSEALMILGVDREVNKEVVQELEAAEGILDVSAIKL